MNSQWEIEEAPRLHGRTVEWHEPGRAIISCGNRLYESGAPEDALRPAGAVPAPLWKRAAASFRPGARLLRFMTYNALPAGGGSIFVTFGKQYGVLSGGRFRPAAGIENPSRVLRGACAPGPGGRIFFGEYVTGRERKPIRIYALDAASARAEVVRTFEAGEVRHVHGIYRDPYTDELWCLTGDLPGECRILKSSDGFETIETAGAGDETWRAVSIQFRRDALYYATDAEFEKNHIYRIDRQTGRRDTLAAIDGPVYYSRSAGGDLFFCVTAELCPSQEGRSSTLWRVDADDNVTQVFSAEKDMAAVPKAVKFFLPGLLNFPAGPGLPDMTYFSATALAGIDNKTFRLMRK